MTQVALCFDRLPPSPLEASAAFFSNHLGEVRAAMEDIATLELAIVLCSAGPDHDDWRRSLARDLAREFTPRRANIIGGNDPVAVQEMLVYLGNAPGVTGQYLAAHE